MSQPDTFVIVDGNSLMHRAFHALPPLSNEDGVFTNAVFGFLSMLFKVIGDEQPRYLAVAFDLHGPTFRHLKYDGYKATRHPMPEELAMQMPVMKQVLAAMNIPVYACEGWEADDVLGTVGRLCEEAGWDCAILTEDGGAQLGVTLDLPDQLDAKATLDLHWAALETQPEALSDRPVGLFDLSEDELTALEKSIGAQIARLLYGEDMTTGETDAVLTGTWKMQVDLTPNLLDALNDALGLDLQMDDPTVMTMLVTFGEDGSYHMDYDAKALREELNALEDEISARPTLG